MDCFVCSQLDDDKLIELTLGSIIYAVHLVVTKVVVVSFIIVLASSPGFRLMGGGVPNSDKASNEYLPKPRRHTHT